jgi:hypothetical protein
MTARWFQSRWQQSWTGGNLIFLDHMIDFPNHSRSYDQTRRAVRFWGHDSAIEASFFINEDALRRIQPDARPDESGFLKAFDSNRDLICAAAAKVYVRGSRGSYDLVAANFWNNLAAWGRDLRFNSNRASMASTDLHCVKKNRQMIQQR